MKPRVVHAMGMPFVLDVRDEIDHSTFDDVVAWLHQVDETFSTYKETSEISRINQGELAVDDAIADVQEVLRLCDELRTETEGFFDMRAAGRGIDPSGLVKGWSVERAAAILDAAGACNYAINAGGDIVLRGHPRPGEDWRVGIQHPHERDRVAKVVAGTDFAVATSGTYERGEHVLDPHTHRPPEGVLSVTITGPNLTRADAYATAAFAMGAGAPAWTATLSGYEALSILADGTVLSTRGFPAAC